MSVKYVWMVWTFDTALFSAHVAEAVRDTGMEVKEAAEYVGMHPTTLSMIMRNVYEVDRMGIHYVLSLCSALELDPREFFVVVEPDELTTESD